MLDIIWAQYGAAEKGGTWRGLFSLMQKIMIIEKKKIEGGGGGKAESEQVMGAVFKQQK